MPITGKKKLLLSPSALNVYLNCDRCFWLEKNKWHKRPRGIFPSLPNGMDRVIKDYFDSLRQDLVLPIELQGDGLEGVSLFKDQKQLEIWRDWRTGLRYDEPSGKAYLTGAFDDLLVLGDKFVPFDYKTKGTKTTREDAVKYYSNQLNCYGLMLEENGMPCADFGVLLYYSPKAVAEDGVVRFTTQTIKVPVDPERGRKIFDGALALLDGSCPPVKTGCEYCTYLNKK